MAQYFDYDADSSKLVRKYHVPAKLVCVKQQYRYFLWRFPGDALFFQVGRFMECYDVGKPNWIVLLALKRMSHNRRGACYGFPVSQWRKYLWQVLDQGKVVTVIREHEGIAGSIKTRVPVWRYTPI